MAEIILTNLVEFLFYWLKPSFSVYDETRKWLKKKSIPHFVEKEFTSTNDKAKAEAFSISEPIKNYLVDQQTNGRGRGSNSWDNPKPGDSLMMSFSFAIDGNPQPIATPLAGLAMAKNLEQVFALQNISLKAPNDVLLGGKKVAGILVEAVQMGSQCRLIIGLGLNVFSKPQTQEQAGFLKEGTRVTQTKWRRFLDQLQLDLKLASQESLGTHLSDNQRKEILRFLNNNPNLTDPYDSLSPFGDLSSGVQVTSWRDL